MHGAFRLWTAPSCADRSRQHYIAKADVLRTCGNDRGIQHRRERYSERKNRNGQRDHHKDDRFLLAVGPGPASFPTGRHTHGRTTGSLEHLPLGTQTNCVRVGSISHAQLGHNSCWKTAAGIFIKPACLQACSASRMTRRVPQTVNNYTVDCRPTFRLRFCPTLMPRTPVTEARYRRGQPLSHATFAAPCRAKLDMRHHPPPEPVATAGPPSAA